MKNDHRYDEEKIFSLIESAERQTANITEEVKIDGIKKWGKKY